MKQYTRKRRYEVVKPSRMIEMRVMRMRLGLTLKEASEPLKISWSSLYNYENLITRMPLAKYKELKAYYSGLMKTLGVKGVYSSSPIVELLMLRVKLQACGVCLKDLSEILGISRYMLQKYFKGLAPVPVEVLGRMNELCSECEAIPDER